MFCRNKKIGKIKLKPDRKKSQSFTGRVYLQMRIFGHYGFINRRKLPQSHAQPSQRKGRSKH